MNLTKLQASLDGMSIYTNLLHDAGIKSLLALFSCQTQERARDEWSNLHSTLSCASLSLCDYIYSLLLYDDNPFTRQCALHRACPPALLAAAASDLSALGALARVTPGELKAALKNALPESADIAALPDFATEQRRYIAPESDWSQEIPSLRDFCAENGCGSAVR